MKRAQFFWCILLGGAAGGAEQGHGGAAAPPAPRWPRPCAVDRWVKIAEVIVNFVNLTRHCGTEHNYADFAQPETELYLNRLDFGDCN